MKRNPAPTIDREHVQAFRNFVLLVIVVVAPFLISLISIEETRPLVDIETEAGRPSSPYGYTWSLAIFLVPCLLIGRLVHLYDKDGLDKKAFWWTAGILIPVWCLLDIFLGLTFFRFPNTHAYSFNVPGWHPEHGWVFGIPIEEFGFYIFGFLTMLLVYCWTNVCWLSAYRRSPELKLQAGERPRLFWPALYIGAFLYVIAYLYKKFGPVENPEGFPGYFLFLLFATIIPSLLFLTTVLNNINWPALSFTFLYIFGVSVFWEAALGVPYQWWGFNKEQMIGVFFKGLNDLPIEELILWVFASFTTIVIYETIRLIVSHNSQDRASVARTIVLRNRLRSDN